MHEVIFDSQTLIFAYNDIVKSKMTNTRSWRTAILGGINLKKIRNLSKNLLKGSWLIRPVKRVIVLTKTLSKSCLLMVLSPYDHIIAIAIEMILSLVFEKHEGLDFLPVSRYFSHSTHSFRTKKGCHTALNALSTWGLPKWFISAHIYKCFDNINLNKFISIINRSILDQ